MGDLTNSLISHRARVLFLIVIYFLVLMVNAVFLLVIAALLNKYPTAVIPIFIEIPLAVGIGWLFYKYTKWGILLPSIGALAVMYLTILLAATLGWEVTVPAINDSTIVTWVLIFLVYGFIATLLPVWVLLQPRDYINGHQLYIGLAVVFVAVLIGTVLHGDGLPVMAPALNLTPEGAPLIFPFLFVTIACGAISGFHARSATGARSARGSWRSSLSWPRLLASPASRLGKSTTRVGGLRPASVTRCRRSSTASRTS
jgi:carbon starvation protein